MGTHPPEAAQAATTSGVRPFADIPKLGLRDTVRAILAGGGGRSGMHATLRRMYDAYGPISAGRGGPIRFVHLFGPDANRFVLLDREGVFSARRPWMQIMGRIFPNGLLLRDGEEHRRHRRILQEAFTTPALHGYAERMSPMITAELAGWGGAAQPLRVFPAFKTLTLHMAAAIFLGEELGPGTQRMNQAFEDMVAASMSRIRLRLPGLEFNRGLQGRAFMGEFLRTRLAAKRANGATDMFSRLCNATSEDGHTFHDQDIIDHMVFLMMAAHDTTTSTLTSMTYELARHPAWQDRVRAESVALGNGQPSLEDLERLTSLTWVMRETLRRYPPLPVIPRVATAPVAFGGFEIPADTMVIVAPILTHHLSEWWTDPFRFDPERFAPGRAEHERHTHSWIPFGGGPHLCIGFRFAETQIRLIMHQLVRRFQWTVPDGYEMPVQEAPISKPRDGLPIHLTPLT